MRIVGRGHEAVRATHTKTLELTPDADITERATCVLAVGGRVEPPLPLAGPIELTIAAGGQRATVRALANPLWDPAGPAVVRRSALRLPGTLATLADAAAADLPRELVAALRDPHREVIVEVLSLDPSPALVLAGADPARPLGPALAAELAAAASVIVEDDGARALVGRGDPVPDSISTRTLVVATDDLPGRTVPLADVAVETLGLSPRQAAAAACPSRAPVVFLPGAAQDAALADAPADYRVVLTVAADRLERTLARAHDIRAATTVTLAQPWTAPWTHEIGRPLALASREPVACCLHPVGGGLDPRPLAAARALLAEGVATRAVARALAELTGWPRRRAYDAVLALHPEERP